MTSNVKDPLEKEYKKIAIVGAGNIGSQLAKDLFDADKDIKEMTVLNSKDTLILDRDDIETYKAWSERVDADTNTLSNWMKLVVKSEKENETEYYKKSTWSHTLQDNDVKIIFITTPSNINGLIHTNASRSFEKNIITCEKYSLSNEFEHFSDYIKEEKIGITATVGGGTGMSLALMDYIENNSSFDSFYGIVNGTTNYILTACSNGTSIDAAALEALKKRYTEPGAEDAQSIIKEEVKDIIKKATILYNMTLLSTGENRFINENQIKTTDKYEKTAYRYIDDFCKNKGKKIDDDKSEIKLVVNITNQKSPNKNKEKLDMTICSYKNPESIYALEIGFIKTDKELLKNIKGVNNGAVISKSGIYENLVEPGPGAGPIPTATRMINDYRRLNGMK